MTEPAYYLGYRDEDGNGPPVGGSAPMKCSKCGAVVFVSPEGQKLLGARPIPLICVPCAIKIGRVAAAA